MQYSAYEGHFFAIPYDELGRLSSHLSALHPYYPVASYDKFCHPFFIQKLASCMLAV